MGTGRNLNRNEVKLILTSFSEIKIAYIFGKVKCLRRCMREFSFVLFFIKENKQ